MTIRKRVLTGAEHKLIDKTLEFLEESGIKSIEVGSRIYKREGSKIIEEKKVQGKE